jgi:hypothetical protein
MYHFSAPYQFFQNLIGGHVIVDEAIAKTLIIAGQNRLTCTINGLLTIHCALISKGDGTHFIMLNKVHAKKLGAREGHMLAIQLVPDISQYGMPIPEELEALLEMDDEFDKAFHALTPGKQRTLIHAITTVKNTDGRLRRALIICDYIKGGGKKIDQMTINELLKENLD